PRAADAFDRPCQTYKAHTDLTGWRSADQVPNIENVSHDIGGAFAQRRSEPFASPAACRGINTHHLIARHEVTHGGPPPSSCSGGRAPASGAGRLGSGGGRRRR